MDSRFDEEFRKILGLSWLPWIGSEYDDNGILVLGESNYSNDDPASVDADANFTRSVVRDLALRSGNDTFDRISKFLNPNCRKWRETTTEEDRKSWARIAFMDVSQRCVIAGGRPVPADLVKGWAAVRKVIELLNPKVIICFSPTAMSHCQEFAVKNEGNINRVVLRKGVIKASGGERFIFTVCHPAKWWQFGGDAQCFIKWRAYVSDGSGLSLPTESSGDSLPSVSSDSEKSGSSKVLEVLRESGLVMSGGIHVTSCGGGPRWVNFNEWRIKGAMRCVVHYEVVRPQGCSDVLCVELHVEGAGTPREFVAALEREPLPALGSRIKCGKFAVRIGDHIDCTDEQAALDRIKEYMQVLFDWFEPRVPKYIE